MSKKEEFIENFSIAVVFNEKNDEVLVKSAREYLEKFKVELDEVIQEEIKNYIKFINKIIPDKKVSELLNK